VGAKLFRADGQTDRQDDANVFFLEICKGAWKQDLYEINPEPANVANMVSY
jgi:hypothetical protein